MRWVYIMGIVEWIIISIGILLQLSLLADKVKSMLFIIKAKKGILKVIIKVRYLYNAFWIIIPESLILYYIGEIKKYSSNEVIFIRSCIVCSILMTVIIALVDSFVYFDSKFVIVQGKKISSEKGKFYIKIVDEASKSLKVLLTCKDEEYSAIISEKQRKQLEAMIQCYRNERPS